MVDVVGQGVEWQQQLADLYPEGQDQAAHLATRYLEEILDRSNSPVAAMVWSPGLSDSEWAATMAKIKASDTIENDPQKRALLFEKMREVGHAVLLWRTDAGGVGYASFWPQGDNGGPGHFRTFLQDVTIEKRLPDYVLGNLTANEWGRFLGRKILGWDIENLDDTFQRLQNNPPAFDIKAREGGHSCSSMLMHLVEQTCETAGMFHETRGLLGFVGDQLTGNGEGPVKAVYGSFVGLVVSPFVVALDALGEVGSMMRDAERSFRSNTLTPNYIRQVFYRATSNERKPGPPIEVQGTKIRLLDAIVDNSDPDAQG